MVGSKRRLAEALAAVHKEIARLESALMAETVARMAADQQLAGQQLVMRLDADAELVAVPNGDGTVRYESSSDHSVACGVLGVLDATEAAVLADLLRDQLDSVAQFIADQVGAEDGVRLATAKEFAVGWAFVLRLAEIAARRNGQPVPSDLTAQD